MTSSRYLGILMLLLLPLELSAQGDGMQPPGDCSKTEYRALSSAAGTACKSQPMACDEKMDCAELITRWSRFEACIKARKILMDRCFRGGDQIHKDVLDGYQQGQASCSAMIWRKCRKDEPCRDQ